VCGGGVLPLREGSGQGAVTPRIFFYFLVKIGHFLFRIFVFMAKGVCIAQ